MRELLFTTLGDIASKHRIQEWFRYQSEEQKPLYYLLPSIFVLSILLEISSQADNDAGGLGKIGMVGFLTSTHLSFIPVLLIGDKHSGSSGISPIHKVFSYCCKSSI
ncbi:hypothetical protein HFZ78_18555 [Priestia megaterium]|uniref:Uncharacterized protein n=1 Tax=Priestia megaterium TaxID=1404 RepID=A0A6H1P4J1_PRIMG|nr:hypothetical protein [Priestia megaterium]QIZ08463.1 hypothetical protein HFZ78_18555 [Priestia megaterium]